MNPAESPFSRSIVLAGALLIATSPVFAKDKEVELKDVPAGVQATIKKTTDAGATLEKVEVEEGTGGTQYGAKITDKNGLRWEVIMDATGKVVKTEQRKAKK